MESPEALKSLRFLDGFRLDLLAAEPRVIDLVAAAYGEDGRLCVVEMTKECPVPPRRPLRFLFFLNRKCDLGCFKDYPGTWALRAGSLQGLLPGAPTDPNLPATCSTATVSASRVTTTRRSCVGSGSTRRGCRSTSSFAISSMGSRSRLVLSSRNVPTPPGVSGCPGSHGPGQPRARCRSPTASSSDSDSDPGQVPASFTSEDSRPIPEPYPFGEVGHCTGDFSAASRADARVAS